jgi:hypothetical protein
MNCGEEHCGGESVDDILAEAAFNADLEELSGPIKVREEDENPLRVIMQMWCRLRGHNAITCEECEVIGEAVEQIMTFMELAEDVLFDDDSDDDDDDAAEEFEKT